MADIADFLAARIYEDECTISELTDEQKEFWTAEQTQRWTAETKLKSGILLNYMIGLRRWETTRAYGIAGVGPAPDVRILHYLALPYVDHPDYRESWAPPEPGTIETWERK